MPQVTDRRLKHMWRVVFGVVSIVDDWGYILRHVSDITGHTEEEILQRCLVNSLNDWAQAYKRHNSNQAEWQERYGAKLERILEKAEREMDEGDEWREP